MELVAVVNIYALIGEILPSAFHGVAHVTSWRERVLASWNFTSAEEGDEKTRTQVVSHLKWGRAVMRAQSRGCRMGNRRPAGRAVSGTVGPAEEVARGPAASGSGVETF